MSDAHKQGLQMRSDMVPGSIFPDYEPPDHTTKRRKLSELQGQYPRVLVLSRGGFCPKERPELKAAWQQGREEIFYPYVKTYNQSLGEHD
jgi:hypothetical protein